MLCNEECQGTETVEGREVCVLGESKNLSGRCDPCGCKTCRAGCERPGLWHSKPCMANVTKSLQAHRHLQLLAQLVALTSSRNLGRNRHTGLFDVRHRHVQRRSQTDPLVNRYIGCHDVAATIGLNQGILLSGLYGTSKI